MGCEYRQRLQMQNVPLSFLDMLSSESLQKVCGRWVYRTERHKLPRGSLGFLVLLYTFLVPERTTLIIHSELSLISLGKRKQVKEVLWVGSVLQGVCWFKLLFKDMEEHFMFCKILKTNKKKVNKRGIWANLVVDIAGEMGDGEVP